MALDYNLSIATALEPIQALQFVSEEVDLEWSSTSLKPSLFGPGIWVGADTEDNSSQSMMEEAFGFKPTIYVWFRLNSNKDYEKGNHILLRVTIKLLSQISGDAVLLFNGEKIVLQRISGQLLLNEESKPWITSLLFEVTLPYELRNLPSPLL